MPPRMRAEHKKLLMIALVGCFFAQGALVYTDRTPTRPASSNAATGKRVWQANNCQACHQIYGMGGFLGPDLTNAYSRVPRQRIDVMVKFGFGQMPKFQISDEELNSLVEFLAYVDTTGKGQLRPTKKLPWWVYGE